MERVKTGIRGFDKLTFGGIPRGHTILVSGQTGAGKTIFGLQYLVNGATKFNEKGIFISFEESRADLLGQAETLGLDLDGLEVQKKIKILTFKPAEEHIKTIIEQIEADVSSFKPRRLVFDSISTYGVYAETLSFLEMMIDYGINKNNLNITTPDSALRRAVMDIMEKIKSFGVTSIVISELPESSNYLSRDTISEFLADGIVLLKHIPIGNALNRSIEIRKLRQSEILEGSHSYTITKGGINIEQ